MSIPYIEKLAKQGKGSVENLEKEWNEAKKDAEDEGKGDNYAYVTSIFKRRINASTKEMNRLFGARWTGQGAGIFFFCTTTERVLWVKRSDQGDHPNEWAWPGGGVEPGETPEQAALRECQEEIGFNGDVTLRPAYESHSDDGFVFFTFIGVINKEFIPTLNDEHTDYVWAKFEEPPHPLHPGCQEYLDVAEAQARER